MTDNPTPKKTLSVFALVMINVVAIDSLRTLPISAVYGTALVALYLIAAAIFFIPTALVSAELATGWPATGGLYVWVREAFGKRWAFVTIWLQWIYNVVWYPTIMAFIAGTLAYLIDPHLAHNKTYMLSTVLILYWLATALNCFGMKISALLSTLGTLLGTLLPMILIALLGAYWLYSGKISHVPLTVHALTPPLGNLNQWSVFIGLLFGLVGIEMSASHAEDVKNPQRDYPRAVLYSTLLILSTLIFASLAIAVVVPLNSLNLVTGLIEAFQIFLVTYHLNMFLPIMVILIILGGFGSVSAWIIGPTKGLMIASRDGSLPRVLMKTNRHGAPYLILIIQALLVTLLSCTFLLMPTVNSSYWLLTDMTAQLALIVYCFMFSAAIYLRYRHPTVPRHYKIPGGNCLMWVVAGLGFLTCISAIGLGFMPPSQFNVGSLFRYESLLIGGIVVFCTLPLLIFRFCHKVQ